MFSELLKKVERKDLEKWLSKKLEEKDNQKKGPRLFGANILCFLLTLTQTLNKWTVKEHRTGAETICAENVRQRNR